MLSKTDVKDWVIWRLQRGLDRRFRSGHPWAYSNELTESPKGIEPGSKIELRDSKDQFLARGYGNPKSLISFRALSRDPKLLDPTSASSLLNALKRAAGLRKGLGLGSISHRWVFGEADSLPGVIIDRYVLSPSSLSASPAGQVLVIQAHTAGAERLIPTLVEALEEYFESVSKTVDWKQTAIVLRNDLSVRKFEGLSEDEPRVLREVPGMDFSRAKIQVKAALEGDPLVFEVDLLRGQKTGFFLDQASNIELAALRLRNQFSSSVRILDLCCYVGQWSAQLARVFQSQGMKVEVVAADASAQALEMASRNIEAQGARCETWKGDVLKDLGQVPDRSFDLVVSDPPALIKSRKDIPVGSHAYLQLATQAFRLAKSGGAVVSCSCSGLLDEETFVDIQNKGARRNNVQVRWVGRGFQSPDHPALAEFPEGRYLKAWVGIVD